MNCRPGDLARVISDPETRRAGIVDKILRVRQMRRLYIFGEPAWTYEGPRLFCACPCQRELELIGDSLLRPIRGGEGEDEILCKVGKPAAADQPVTA